MNVYQQVANNQRLAGNFTHGELAETERLFAQFKRRGLWEGVRGWASRRSAALTDLGSAVGAKTDLTSSNEGTQTVPLEKITGTLERNRTYDFDSNFRPTSDRTKERWMAVATLFRRGRTIAPIDLIQYGQRYFVVDGHHRVSVAKALGWDSLQANVTMIS